MKDRTGETCVASNGQTMVVINYRGSNDLDVQFEDGTIVQNKTYAAFLKGNVRNPNKKNISNRCMQRVGQTVIANNGQKMTLIAFRDAKDIDVQFEDGTIVKNKSYANFIRNEIWNPNCPTVRVPKKDRTGEESISMMGQKMKIICYRNCADVDVEFEDGTIVKNCSYKSFQKGVLQNPTFRKAFQDGKLGEVSIATNGQKMTIVGYRNAHDVDIQFEDGTVIRNRRYRYFKTGQLRNPNFTK